MERAGSAVATSQPVASSSRESEQRVASGGKRAAGDADLMNNNSRSQTSAEDSLAGMNEGKGMRASKKPRLVWTTELHQRFLNAVNHLGVKSAVPKTILQLMNVEGMTRENVASHLQKYRLYLKRLQGLPPNAQLPDDRRPPNATTFGAAPGTAGTYPPGNFRAPVVGAPALGMPPNGATTTPPNMLAQQPAPGQPGMVPATLGVIASMPGSKPQVGAGYPAPQGQVPAMTPAAPTAAGAAPMVPGAAAGQPGVTLGNGMAQAQAAAANFYPAPMQQAGAGYSFPGYGALPASTLAAAAANFRVPQAGPQTTTLQTTAEAAVAAAALVSAAARYPQAMAARPGQLPAGAAAAQVAAAATQAQGASTHPMSMLLNPGVVAGASAAALAARPEHSWWQGANMGSNGMVSGMPGWPGTAAVGVDTAPKR